MPPHVRVDQPQILSSTPRALDWVDLLEWLADKEPDDDSCLEYLWRSLYAPDGESAVCPRCGVMRRFRRYFGKVHRDAWTCTACGHYVYPRSGTIFQKSSTPLAVWFKAISLVATRGRSLTSRQLQRELRVTYKTAWRMSKLIRDELTDVVPLATKTEITSGKRAAQ